MKCTYKTYRGPMIMPKIFKCCSSRCIFCCSLRCIFCYSPRCIFWQYAISQLRIVRSGLHLVTYLDVGNFCDKSTETTLHEICAQVFLRFSDSSKPGQSVSLIYELAGLVVIRKSKDNLLRIPCKVAPVTKVAHIFWWRHDNKSASAREHWCDVSCDIPYSRRGGGGLFQTPPNPL